MSTRFSVIYAALSSGGSMDTNETRGNRPAGRRCRTKAITDIKSFAECLEPGSQSCPHVIEFGYVTLCHHPEWQKMMSGDGGE